MAEGGLTSLRDGSYADFDIVCTPCGEDNIREEAVKYCPECQEYLCTTCTRHHGRQKITRAHKLQASSTAKQSPMAVMTTKCRLHSDLKIDMYCGAHDMVYCAKCVAKEHRTCQGVIDIEDAKPSVPIKSEIQRLQTDTKMYQERLVHIGKMTQKNIESLEKQRGEIADKIEEVERKFIEHIQKLKHEAVNILKNEYDEAKTELESTASLVDDTRKEMEKSSKKMQSLLNMDARQQFTQMKLIQNTLTDTGKMLTENEAKGNKTLCFIENSDLKTSIMTSSSLGSTLTGTERGKQQIIPKLYKVKSKKEINVKMKTDQSTCYITGICQLPDGTLILAEGTNKKIKRLDMNFNIKDHCYIDDYAAGVCCTGQNEVAVKMNNDKVQFISVGSSLSKLRQISIEGGYVSGMAYCAGDLWISTGRGVNVYSISGSRLKTICKDINGQKIFKSIPQHMAVSGETVIVTDSSDGAVYLGKDGKVRGEVRDDRLGNTTGVCVSGDGTVFLSGYSSNNVVMFDKDGKCLGELEAKDTGLVNPSSMCYDDRSNCLIVTPANSNNILIFYISG